MSNVIEYRAIASKVTAKDGEVHITSSVEGGKTVRIILGLAPLLAIIQATKADVLQIEDEKE